MKTIFIVGIFQTTSILEPLYFLKYCPIFECPALCLFTYSCMKNKILGILTMNEYIKVTSALCLSMS